MSLSGTQRFERRIGRIGAITSIPVQIRLDEIESLLSDSVDQSEVAKEMFKQFRGYNFLEVKCMDEEGHNCEMLQCFVPQSIEHAIPCLRTIDGVTFTVDHALPYALPLTVSSRPPVEETRHDHWNKAAC